MICRESYLNYHSMGGNRRNARSGQIRSSYCRGREREREREKVKGCETCLGHEE